MTSTMDRAHFIVAGTVALSASIGYTCDAAACLSVGPAGTDGVHCPDLVVDEVNWIS